MSQKKNSQTKSQTDLNYLPIEGEAWRRCPSFKGYSASSLGRVKKDSTGRILKQVGADGSRPYACVNLQIAGKPKLVETHRVVADAFHGPIQPQLVVNHKDPSQRWLNTPENLEITNQRANVHHAMRHGRLKTKLTPDDVRRIRALTDGGVALDLLSQVFSITLQHLKTIVSGKTWKAITDDLTAISELAAQPA